MIKLIKSLLLVVLISICFPLASQAPAFEEMEFEPDSTKSVYKPVSKNNVYIRSKRGNNGVNKTPAANAILSSEVTEIVLVFSELDPSSIADREEANRERWENLLMTYPELFQFSTTYKNVCQCNNNGDSAAFKKMQGFYVYVNGEVPKVAEESKPVASTPAPEPAKPVKVAETPAPAKTTKAVEPPAAAKTPNVAVTDNTSVKTKEPPPAAPAPETRKETPAKETVKETPKAVEPEAPAEEEPAAVVEKPVKKKPAAIVKARRAKDPKACRPACYGYGDEDLILYFKDSFPLTKKEKRKAKGWVANVKIQIHFDGSIKKTMVTGTNEEFNKKVEDVVKSMKPWNAAVKSGLATKSEVRFTLKYDKDSKSLKPFDMVMNPKPSPRCPCVSDSEMFGSD